MVTIIGLEKRKNRVKNEEFNVLVIQGEIEVVLSKTTGRPYLTARKTSIPCTFDEKLAQNLIGHSLPGGKAITLNHTFQYSPAPATVEEVVG